MPPGRHCKIVQRRGGRWTAALIGLMPWSVSARDAPCRPFVDADFTTQSAGNDPDLVVVRERFDSASRTQSLYLRARDGDPAWESFSGELRVRGAEIIDVITSGGPLIATDAVWGLDGIDYGAAFRRGLEGDDVATHTPAEGDVRDALIWARPDTVRFWFGTTDDVDDIRVLVRYPSEGAAASFDVALYDAEAPGPDDWPPTLQGGIQIGRLVDAAPDDGDYSEVFEVRRVKLCVEDLDIIEASIVVGSVPLGGGVAGPSQARLDNFGDATDFDEDNGFDQNGLISPIPTNTELSHLRWSASRLVGSTEAVLPAARLRVEGVPATLGAGSSATVRIRADVSPEAPNDRYAGLLAVWEDADLDGEWGETETGDRVELIVDVGRVDEHGRPLERHDTGASDGALARDGGTDATAGDADRADIEQSDTVATDASPTDAALIDVAATEAGWLDGPLDRPISIDSTTAASDLRIMPPADATWADIGQDAGQRADHDPGEGGVDGPRLSTHDRASTGGARALGEARGGGLDCRASVSTPPPAALFLAVIAWAIIRLRSHR